MPVAPAGRSYSMKVTDGLYRQGTRTSGWHGDDLCGVLWFDSSFLLPFYDTAWDGVCVTTNGALAFDRASTPGNNTELPSRTRSTRSTRSGTTSSSTTRRASTSARPRWTGWPREVIEWRNVAFYVTGRPG